MFACRCVCRAGLRHARRGSLAFFHNILFCKFNDYQAYKSMNVYWPLLTRGILTFQYKSLEFQATWWTANIHLFICHGQQTFICLYVMDSKHSSVYVMDSKHSSVYMSWTANIHLLYVMDSKHSSVLYVMVGKHLYVHTSWSVNFHLFIHHCQ